MTKIINQIMWFVRRHRLEKDLLQYCEMEYPASDVMYAYHRVLSEHKAAYLQKAVW